jgi:5'(3')-deoxyribonucleotidase
MYNVSFSNLKENFIFIYKAEIAYSQNASLIGNDELLAKNIENLFSRTK